MTPGCGETHGSGLELVLSQQTNQRSMTQQKNKQTVKLPTSEKQTIIIQALLCVDLTTLVRYFDVTQ